MSQRWPPPLDIKNEVYPRVNEALDGVEAPATTWVAVRDAMEEGLREAIRKHEERNELA